MKAITSESFKVAVSLNPAWASKLSEPVEITGPCDMAHSRITHLSPLLHFTGKSRDGYCAVFYNCKSLKIAEGNFKGHVDFTGSGIEKIGELSCGKTGVGNCASFWCCESLKVAEGKFEGFVDFDGSGIEKIGDLSCGKNENGMRFSVENCPKLTRIPVIFNSREINAAPKLLEKLKVDRFIQKKRTEVVEIEL